MKKQNKNKDKFRIEISKNNVKIISKVLISLFLSLIGFIIIENILISLVFGILNMFLFLFKLYPLLSNEAMFFGGFLFLYIAFKAFEIGIQIILELIKMIKKLMK
jgi:hypothetical protein